MHAQRVTSIAAALALVVAPAAFAGIPRGSHGQETDKRATQSGTLCGVGSAAVFAVSQARFAVPKGSHGQETDRAQGLQPTLRLACISRSATVLAVRSAAAKATPPRGSHGQETDRPRT